MNQTILSGGTIKELGTIMGIVRHILKHHPETRGNDRFLIVYVEEYCREEKLPAPVHESITRCRRKIQNNEQLYLPDIKTVERRVKKCQEYSEYFGE